MEKNMEVSENNGFMAEPATVDRQSQDDHFTVWFGLLGLLLCLLVVLNSNYFTIRQVIVKGNRLVATEAILLATRLPQRQNLLTIDCSRIATVIKRNPNIAAARILKRYPNQLVIMVRERRPVCLLQQGRILYIVGNDFMVMGRATEGIPDQLPVISGMQVRKGHSIPVLSGPQKETLGELLKLTMGMPRLRIQRIDWAHSLIVLEIVGNPGTITVLLGDSSRIKEQIAQLRAVLAINTAGDIVSVDLRIQGISTVTTSRNKIP